MNCLTFTEIVLTTTHLSQERVAPSKAPVSHP
ncbi:hypothetical protein ACVWXS_003246 [Lysinibacillus sp. TE18511]